MTSNLLRHSVVVESLERDLREGFDSQLDQSEGRYSRLAVSRGRSHVDDPSESHVLASVVGVPGSSSVDCGRVAEVVERRHDAPKRLRLQFAGSQATTVPASRLDAPPHFEMQGCIRAGASARVEDPSSQRVGAFADTQWWMTSTQIKLKMMRKVFVKDLWWVPKLGRCRTHQLNSRFQAEMSGTQLHYELLCSLWMESVWW